MLTVDKQTFEIRMSRGDDASISFDIYDSNGVLKNCTGATFKFTVKKSIDDPIASAKFQRTSPAGTGIDTTNAASGNIVVGIIPANTSALAGTYFYDLQMTESGGYVRTIRQGRFIVEKQVTTT